MNIAIITQMYPEPDDLGGNKVTKTVEYFAKEWVEEGHNVYVFHCSSKFPIALYLIPKSIKDKFAYKTSMIIPSFSSRKALVRENLGIHIERMPMFKFLPGKPYSKRKLKSYSKKIIEKLNNLGVEPDLIMGHFANPSLEIVANISEHFKCKSSIVFHNEVNENSVSKYRIKENISRVKAVGARSIVEAKSIQSLLNLKDTPFICCSGVPNEAVKNAIKVCDKHNFDNGVKHLYVGSLISRKHLDKVIDSFVQTSTENDGLEIIGGGPEENNLKKLVTDLNTNRVQFLGRVSRDEVLLHMKESQVFTLISDNETFGMVYIEAMLQGCLVIASKGGGFDGIIKDGENGFICNPGDKEMLSTIYMKIKNMSEEERNKIGQAAIDTALHYSEREVADRYLSDVIKRN